MPESRYAQYCKKVDFIQKHIFPGGHCPSFQALVNACDIGTNSQMFVDEMINIGPHYSKALSIWRAKFMEHFDQFSEHSGMGHIYDEVFKRKWEFYFAFCQVGFAIRTLGVLQIRFTRVNNQNLLKGIPLE
jgi:cyclopropane-fatty-acyl-phospholipid synthase